MVSAKHELGLIRLWHDRPTWPAFGLRLCFGVFYRINLSTLQQVFQANFSLFIPYLYFVNHCVSFNLLVEKPDWMYFIQFPTLIVRSLDEKEIASKIKSIETITTSLLKTANQDPSENEWAFLQMEWYRICDQKQRSYHLGRWFVPK